MSYKIFASLCVRTIYVVLIAKPPVGEAVLLKLTTHAGPFLGIDYSITAVAGAQHSPIFS
jgi:hypothetical protein